jgi:hypothetical protein
MDKLKINFVDFWPNFLKEDNYFYHLLSRRFDVVIDEHDPDLLFFSVDYNKSRERDRFVNHRCKKIFYTGESVPANFDIPTSIECSNHLANYSIGQCDYAFTFDFSDDPRQFRLPLWALQIDWFKKGGYGNPEYLLPLEDIDSNHYIKSPKTKFCAFIFNNPIPQRLEAYRQFEELYKKVDGYGTPFNNWFYGEREKYNILKDYKFSICFENRLYPGYYTEKLFHAKTSGTVPIYYADKNVGYDFNEKSFINLNDFESMRDLIKHVQNVDCDDELYCKYTSEPLFKGSEISPELFPEKVLSFFEDMVLKRGDDICGF